MVTHWLPCWVSGVTRSVRGLVGPVSVYFDWVRQLVCSISVWQVFQSVEGDPPVRRTLQSAEVADLALVKTRSHAF